MPPGRPSKRARSRRVAPDAAAGGVPVGGLVNAVLKSLLTVPASSTEQLEHEWPELIGPPFAAHCRPGRLLNGELTVFVDSSVWLSELQRVGHGEMLAKLQARLGRQQVRRLRFCPDPGR